MSGWWRDHAVYGWIGALAGVVAAAVAVVTLLDSPATDDEDSVDAESTTEAIGKEPAEAKGERPSSPARIPVRWHGSIRLSTNASGVGTDPFDDADLDADPVVPGEDGDITLDYDGILELGDGVAFGRWSSGGKPSREDCLRRATSHPMTEAELAAGSYVCALSDQERPVRVEVPDGVVAGADTRAVELVITTWER